jgi:hypothetical protein
MSNDVALALVAASTFPGFFCYIYSGKLANALPAQIISGVANGIPIPVEWRWRLLYQRWVYYVGAGIGASLVVAAFNFTVARLATDGGVQALAYLVAFLAALVALAWMLSSISELSYFRRVLKATTND